MKLNLNIDDDDDLDNIGTLYMRRGRTKEGEFVFKFIVPRHKHKANYNLVVCVSSKRIEVNKDSSLVNVNYPGLLKRIQEEITDHLKGLETG
jgi:hypothetical protein